MEVKNLSLQRDMTHRCGAVFGVRGSQDFLAEIEFKDGHD
jgi:hypothetical protein